MSLPEKREHYPVFDYLRLFLALEVVLFHATDNPRFLLVPAVPSFLAISGFLILRSWNTSRDGLEFWAKRALRLLPALFLSFCLVAALFPPDGFKMAVLQWLTFGIMGAHNAPVWSLGWEEVAYASLAFLCWLRVVTPKTSTIAALAICAGYIWIAQRVPLDRAAHLAPAFAIGVALSQMKLKIHWAVVLAAVALSLKMPQYMQVLIGAVAVLQLGTLPVAWLPKLRDISYGLYIFHFPILKYLKTQSFTGLELLTFTLIGALALSILSSRYIEQPIMKWGRSKLAQKKSRHPVEGDGLMVPEAAAA